MFARVFALLPLALLASASHLKARNPVDACNSGADACCKQTMDVEQAIHNQAFVDVIGALNHVAADVLVGLECTDLLGHSCAAGSTCCYNVNQASGINVVNLNCGTTQA